MPEFTQSWAFIFIIGVICFFAGFALAISITASGRRARAEAELICEAAKIAKEFREVETEIATTNNPRTD